jgi:hypothetical protein
MGTPILESLPQWRQTPLAREPRHDAAHARSSLTASDMVGAYRVQVLPSLPSVWARCVGERRICDPVLVSSVSYQFMRDMNKADPSMIPLLPVQVLKVKQVWQEQ